MYRKEQKTRKVMEMDYNDKWYVCIEDSTANTNPYKLYEKWYDGGWHRKKVIEFGNFDSILFYLLQIKYPVASWDLR